MQTSMVICALALAASVVNGQNEGCGLAVLDKCYRGFPLNGSTPDILVETVGEIPSVQECQWFCKELFGGECTWFAFDTQTGQCNIFKGSITDYTSSCELVGYTKEPNVADCSTTLTGDDACYNFREGYCRFEDYVILENLQFVQVLEHCQEACRHRPDCEFFLYEEKDKVCHLEGSQTRICDVVHGLPDPPFGDCLSANKIPFTVSTSGSLNATSAISTTTSGGGTPYDGTQRQRLTHGWWDTNSWTYIGPSCGSGAEVFKANKTNPNSESAYLDTCFGHMPKQFLVYDFEEPVILNKYSWSGLGGECPSSWTVYGSNTYPKAGTDMFLVDTESGDSCQASREMIEFEVDETGDAYLYYVWKMSESDNGNGNNDGYRWNTIQFFTSPGAACYVPNSNDPCPTEDLVVSEAECRAASVLVGQSFARVHNEGGINFHAACYTNGHGHWIPEGSGKTNINHSPSYSAICCVGGRATAV